ncbi:MAG: exodeoxyribonuclease VII small subunit [Oscillospiraceae bacterium]|nr:exodeoxyribonuclease VII small subunit [Oscillospiraceae bacterium]
MNFEESLKRLREICDKLKDEKTSLEETMELYKEGMALSNECTKLLESIKTELDVTYEQAGSNE